MIVLQRSAGRHDRMQYCQDAYVYCNMDTAYSGTRIVRTICHIASTSSEPHYGHCLYDVRRQSEFQNYHSLYIRSTNRRIPKSYVGVQKTGYCICCSGLQSQLCNKNEINFGMHGLVGDDDMMMPGIWDGQAGHWPSCFPWLTLGNKHAKTIDRYCKIQTNANGTNSPVRHATKPNWFQLTAKGVNKHARKKRKGKQKICIYTLRQKRSEDCELNQTSRVASTETPNPTERQPQNLFPHFFRLRLSV